MITSSPRKRGSRFWGNPSSPRKRGPRFFLVLAFLSGSVFAAADEAALGKAEGYPVCTVPELARSEKCLVGTLSIYDAHLKSRKVARAEAPRALKRVPEQNFGYEFRGQKRSLDKFVNESRNTGLLVMRGDTILAERYNYERKPETRFQSFSMAKTVVALLIGIALEEKKIASIDDLAGKYLPAIKDQPYGQTRLRDLLTMSSGVAFAERYDGRDDVTVLARKSLMGEGPGGTDAVTSFTRREHPAGTRFHYSSAETQVLGLVLRAAVGRNLAEYLQEKIWQPMGAEADATWQIDAGGYETGFMGINATLRDWGRLGLLLADGGARDGRQIIPADWIKAATTIHAPHLEVGVATKFNGYGYQTWLVRKGQPQFALLGVRGQGVFVDPETRTVVVHTAVQSTSAGDPHRAEQFGLFYGAINAFPVVPAKAGTQVLLLGMKP